MDRHQWFRCSDYPGEMLGSVEKRVPLLQFRRVAVECCRRIQHLLVDPETRDALKVAELYCDRKAFDDDRELAWRNAKFICHKVSKPKAYLQQAAWAAFLLVSRSIRTSTYRVLDRVRLVKSYEARCNDSDEDETPVQCDIIRDVCGGYFCKSPIWQEHLTPPVLGIAKLVEENNCYEDMPILGDALEEAGVSDRRILYHCREEKFHVRGCWVLDRIRNAIREAERQSGELYDRSSGCDL